MKQIIENAILGGGAEADGDSWDNYPRREVKKWTCECCKYPYNDDYDLKCSHCWEVRNENYREKTNG
tara:strand:- start:408 stop:608 length:201 start_codon:yes stop_codon:yes gene_type:complete